MGFTETEVETMEIEVLTGFEADNDVEIEWIKDQYSKLRIEEKQLVANWKLHKHVRDDGRMRAIAESIKENRGKQAYFAARLKALFTS